MDADPVAIDPRLESWLNTATRGLAPSAISRVRDEIVDHVLDGVESEVSEGEPYDTAVTAVLDSLGDPERVGRSLRRNNLRRWEAEMVGKLAEPLPRWIVALYLLGLPTFVAVTVSFAPLDSSLRVGFFVVGLVAMVAGIGGHVWLARRLARCGWLRAAVASDFLGNWLFYAGLVVGSNLAIGRNTVAAPVVYAVILAILIGLVVHLWPKLRRTPRLG
jgi:hypothetical protein